MGHGVRGFYLYSQFQPNIGIPDILIPASCGWVLWQVKRPVQCDMSKSESLFSQCFIHFVCSLAVEHKVEGYVVFLHFRSLINTVMFLHIKFISENFCLTNKFPYFFGLFDDHLMKMVSKIDFIKKIRVELFSWTCACSMSLSLARDKNRKIKWLEGVGSVWRHTVACVTSCLKNLLFPYNCTSGNLGMQMVQVRKCFLFLKWEVVTKLLFSHSAWV